MRLKIRHNTQYTYERPVTYGLQQLRLTPKNDHNQRVLDWSITIEGGQKELAFQDHNDNHVDLIGFSGDGHTISILCEGEVEITDTSGVVGKHTSPAPCWYFQQATDLTRAGNQTRKLIKGLSGDQDKAIETLHTLSARIREAVAYDTGHTDAQSSAEDALSAGHGVCQDHSHIFIAGARALGFPARYVSGYLMLNDRIDQEASHAWTEAHVDGIGWVGFDISNGISPDGRYVRVATGRDYREAAPISGIRVGDHGTEQLEVHIQVQQ
ncbi:MAG: transglutaminase family protein [Rhodovulum sp.]|nr:transglutaminase family protein [Rhodovulum sp.]